jgi:hypothetical protein
MKLKHILLFSFVVATNVFAQSIDATVCKTAAYSLSTTPASAVLNNKTEYICGNGQRGTIPSLAKQGWHIVSLQQYSKNLAVGLPDPAVTIMVLEKAAK